MFVSNWLWAMKREEQAKTRVLVVKSDQGLLVMTQERKNPIKFYS